jgi:hypothetical protein
MSMNAVEFERSLRERNELRKTSGLPLYDMDKELTRFHENERAAAYAAFVSAHLKPHMQAWDGEPPPTSWSEAQARYGRYLRLRARLLPEIDSKWAEQQSDLNTNQ